MKNLLLVFNIVLLVLVGILFYLHFSDRKPGKQHVTTTKSSDTTKKWQVAYIDLDSLQNSYKYYQKVKADFEKKQNAANNEIAALQKKYQARAIQLQEKGPTMNQQEQESAMREMAQMQENLQSKKQNIDNELFNANSKMKEDILNKIQNFLKDYNNDGRYAYIFSYEPGFMFYKDSTLNITNDVIAGLNAQSDSTN